MATTAPDATPSEVVDWLRARSIALATTEPGNGFADLEPLDALVGDARIVALGEATHGTREFFLLKHRVFEYLVSVLGFTVFAIEASWPDALAVDEYVRTGAGDPGVVLAGLGFWTWNTEEVLALVRWMRQWNESAPDGRKVRFLGFDMQSTPTAAESVASYLRVVDPEFFVRAFELLAPYRAGFSQREYDQRSPEERAALTTSQEELATRFVSERARYVAASSDEAWARAEHHLHIIRQCLAMAMDPNVRDQCMGENVAWLLEHEPVGTRMMLWAHNYHVQRYAPGGADTMGAHLAARFGREFVAIGLAFDRGSFQAIEGMNRGVQGGLREFTVGSTTGDTLDAALAATHVPICIVDLRAVPQDGTVGAWFRVPRETRSIGSRYADDAGAEVFERLEACRAFDALAFVAVTSRARPNFAARNVPRAEPVAKHVQPVNLDFTASPAGAEPTGWIVPERTLRSGYRVEVREDGPRPDVPCVVVRGRPSSPDAFGTVLQRIAAAPHRKRRIRMRAAVRVESPGVAQLWVRLNREDGYVLSFQSMSQSPIVHPALAEYAVETYVASDAEVLTFGVMLTGHGAAWLANVQLESA